MGHKRPRVYPGKDLPLGCWYNVLQFSEPPDIARAAAVNQTCKAASYDDRLWYPLFKKGWSPEYCGSLRTERDGKNFRMLYTRWQTGEPAAVDLIPGVHGPGLYVCIGDRWRAAVQAIQLSQAGPLTAWSVGQDEVLVGTDVTTCQRRNRFLPPENGGITSLNAVAALDSVGLVCAAGAQMIGWDPRQDGNGPSTTPAFRVDYLKATDQQGVKAMISAASPECDGPPQLLTGGHSSMVYLWDLRFVGGGPVRHYEANLETVSCLARDPRDGTLFAGGRATSRPPFIVGLGEGSVTCWDWGTGAQLSTLWTGRIPAVETLAVGRDRVMTSCFTGNVTEWAVPDPQAVVRETEALRVRRLAVLDNQNIYSKSMQGVGEGPDRILAGTDAGSICMWDCREDPMQPPICWSLGDHACPTGVAVTCLAATDQLVVIGSMDGALRIMRVDTHFGQHGN